MMTIEQISQQYGNHAAASHNKVPDDCKAAVYNKLCPKAQQHQWMHSSVLIASIQTHVLHHACSSRRQKAYKGFVHLTVQLM